jgi:hypothetical protein
VTRFFTPAAVYMTVDGGEWLIRRMSNGHHVIGPYTVDSLGYWATEDEARRKLVERAGAGHWLPAGKEE